MIEHSKIAGSIAERDRTRTIRDNGRLRLLDGFISGAGSACVFLLVYYALLPHLPNAWPRGSITKLDLAQLAGALLYPPNANHVTWVIGIASLAILLIACGGVYTVLLAWAAKVSSVKLGFGFGCLLFLGTGVFEWLAFGFQPAVMRGALPDAGFFLFGWSGWATTLLFLSFVSYGAVLGTLIRALSRKTASDSPKSSICSPAN